MRVCVFCGSSTGRDPLFQKAARGLASCLASSGHGLVYGGAHVGLMGIVADTILASGGEVIGVIPHSMAEREIAHRGLTRLHVVQTMHERKALMADLADAFIALPGAYGTLDEFFEILTWAQLGIHFKPCGMLNAGGFFDSLLSFLDGSVAAGFLKPDNRQLFVVEQEPALLLERMANYKSPRVSKWTGVDVR